jgi:hypothetical protein
MVMTSASPSFQQALDVVEALPMDDQILLLDILQKRLIQQKRDQLRHEIAEAEQDYADGNVKRGSVADFMAELDA